MSSSLKKAKRASTAALSRMLELQRHIQLQSKNYLVTISRASELSPALKEAVWQLFRINMERLYKSTDVFVWDPTEKRAELFHRSSRFLLVALEDGRPETDLVAFSMFRFDVEEDMEGKDEYVLYCYELQVSEACRSLGVGKFLAEVLEKLAREWCMEKIMLTVLKANAGATRFYQKQGFVTDDISPEDEGYLILSKTMPPRDSQ